MSIVAPLKYLTISPITKHTATVIFIHGLGDTGHGWEPVAQMFQKEDSGLNHVKWILPHSPTRPVTANMGMEMPSWFDIKSFGFNAEEDEKGMLDSSKQINELISAEVDGGIDSSRIVLGGFSQGGSMSFLTGLTSERKLAGIAVLSGWLPIHKKFKSMLSRHATTTPVFCGHGSTDPLVQLSLCTASIKCLIDECGMPKATENSIQGIRTRIYQGMAHSTCVQELKDLRLWLQSVIPKEVD
ncbi:hypothetical protein APHAL10511_001601 [Amanita phalloides]|nr:hypothetical protein APHAL10511_001601 [Amanita phalloides]